MADGVIGKQHALLSRAALLLGLLNLEDEKTMIPSPATQRLITEKKIKF
jgi:hypothetical protein